MEKLAIANNKRFTSGNKSRTGEQSYEVGDLCLQSENAEDPMNPNLTTIAKVIVLNNKSMPLIIPTTSDDMDQSGLGFILREQMGVTDEDELTATGQASLDAKMNGLIPVINTMLNSISAQEHVDEVAEAESIEEAAAPESGIEKPV